jgi:predicted metal-binding membrane protein
VTLARRARAAILGSLLALSAAGWAVLLWQPSAMLMRHVDNPLTMDMGAALFLAVWVAMMVAMMFPTAAPMVLTFARVQARRRKGGPYVPTWVFLGAYMVIWTMFGALAYAGASWAGTLADGSPSLRDNAARIGGVVVMLAGAYQLSPLKDVCLSRCRSPIVFILGSWRDGYGGALRMGLEHGLYCLGCCWLLFVILFPLGMTNVALLAAIVLVIFAEKSLPSGHRVSRIAAVGLLAYGALVVVVPGALPTTM